MSYLIDKYKGIYRLKTEYDEETKDFPRNVNTKGEELNFSDNDVFIDCKKGKIFYYGKGILQCYVPKLGMGRNILKDLGKELNVDISNCSETKQNNKGIISTIYNYEKFYEALENTKIIFDIEETDEEILFKFKNDNMEIISKYMIPRTSGADISPFSSRNLPKIKYTIPNEDLTEYKKITESISKENKVLLGRLTTSFIATIPQKNKEFRGRDMKALQKKSMLKGKEFIHSLNLWNKYILFLKESLNYASN